MELVSISDIQSFQESKVIKKIPIISDQLMSTLLFIGANTNTPTHNHVDFDEIHYIIQGTGEVRIDGESSPVNEGMMILVPRPKPHNFITSDKQMTVLSFNLVQNTSK
jgi:mannose-6-phosphate isomerase-like protein (cupin superfamily)